MTVVNMGDRPSSKIAQVALKKSADEKKSIYPESAAIIQRNAYMDDIIGGGDSEEDSCLRHAEIGEILSEHVFMIKEWIYTGAKNQFHSSNDQRQVRLLLGFLIWRTLFKES